MYNATVKFCYINDTETTSSKYFPEIVDKQTITVEAPAQDLNMYQYYELFKNFVRACGFTDYQVMDGACRIAFNDSNDEAQMKKLADGYELFLAEDFTARVKEIENQQDDEIAKLKAEIRELKLKYGEIIPAKDGEIHWNAPWNGAVPGSSEAYAKGCRCAILDNQDMPNDKKWVNADCPLHGKVK